MKASAWIDRLKAERGWDSDYRVAKELEVGRSAISRYRSDPESTMDEDVAVRVAEWLGEPVEIVLLDQFAERMRTDRGRTALRGLINRLGKPKGPLLGGGAAAVERDRLDISSVTSSAADAGTLNLQPVHRRGKGPKACHRLHIVFNSLVQLAAGLARSIAPTALAPGLA